MKNIKNLDMSRQHAECTYAISRGITAIKLTRVRVTRYDSIKITSRFALSSQLRARFLHRWDRVIYFEGNNPEEKNLISQPRRRSHHLPPPSSIHTRGK